MSRELYAALAVAVSTCSSEPGPPKASGRSHGDDMSTDGGAPRSDASPPDARADAGDRGQLFAFVGSTTGKIRTYRVDPTNGRWTLASETNAGQNPSFLAFDPPRRRVVAVDEVGAGVVRSFAFDPSTCALSELGSKPSGGSGPTHLSLDPSGTRLFVANYTSGNVSVLPVDPSGKLGDASDTKKSGAKSHWAGTSPAGTHVFVPALGANVIAQYALDAATGKLVENGTAAAPANAGPRHLAFHPSATWAFVINELATTVTSFELDMTSGKLTPKQTVSALPSGQSAQGVTGAEIVVHPSGKHLYASTRGYDSIAQVSIGGDGSIARVANAMTGGGPPRSFAIDPEGTLLFAANQDANEVVGFAIDPSSGALTPLGKTVDVTGPSYVGLARIP